MIDIFNYKYFVFKCLELSLELMYLCTACTVIVLYILVILLHFGYKLSLLRV